MKCVLQNIFCISTAKKLESKRILVVTFKPAVEDAWQADLKITLTLKAGNISQSKR